MGLLDPITGQNIIVGRIMTAFGWWWLVWQIWLKAMPSRYIYLGVMQPTELKTCSLSTAASSESLGPEFLVASMAWMEPSLQRHPWSADLQSWASQSFLPNSPRYFLQYICKLCKHVLQIAHTCKKIRVHCVIYTRILMLHTFIIYVWLYVRTYDIDTTEKNMGTINPS